MVGAAVAITLCACGGGMQSSAIPARTEAISGPTLQAAAAQDTIPFWQSSFSYGGVEYPYQIVGKSPMGRGGSTTIANEIVPLNLVFSDGTHLNAERFTKVLQKSPLYANASFGTVGVTQFGDAVMRAEFWKYAQKKNYHVLLAPPVIEPAVVVNIPAADGHTALVDGVVHGYVTFDYFMDVVEPSIIAQLGIKASTLTIFPTFHTQLLEPGNYCCYDGYHNALKVTTATGTSTFTTVWGPITAAHKITALSHELAEWLNDPFYTNRVPEWIQPGFTTCGGQYLEVADPATAWDFTVDTYLLQDIAEYSWFTRSRKPMGIVPATGKPGYDLMGMLKGPAKSCT
jgi:hypothetical protein